MPSFSQELRKHVTKASEEAQKNACPPPYSASNDPHYNLAIKATDVPQWLWSNSQCRAWIFAVCTELLAYSEEEGEDVAAKFTGFGP
ncbi:hypothetical protein V8E51_017443 [Hyaloscypha variabilis]